MAQAHRQKEVLRAWLKANNHDMAFEKIGAFVIIPPDCSIDRSKVSADVPIDKADNFIAAWTQFGGVTPFGRLFSTGVSATTLRAIANQLAGDHQADLRSVEDMIGLLSAIAQQRIEPGIEVTEVAVQPDSAVNLEGVVAADEDIVEIDARTVPVSIVSEPEPSPITNEPEPAPPAAASIAPICAAEQDVAD